jgi:HEAT repeat protein
MVLLRPYVSSALREMHQRRLVLLGAVLLAVLGTAGAWVASRRAQPALRHHFVPGRRLVFRLEYLSASALDLDQTRPSKGAPSGLSHTAHSSVHGELVVQVLAVEGERVRLAYRLLRPSIQVALDGQLDLALGEALEADLQQPFFVQADRSGRILSVRRSSGRSNVSFGFQRALLAATQVVLPGSAAEGAPSWEVEEDDLNGTAVARYETTAAGAPRGERVRSLHKARLRYLPARRVGEEEEELAAPEHLPEGRLEATVDVWDQHLVSLQGTEVTTTLAQGQAVGRAENTVRLQFLRAETAPAAERQRLEAEATALAQASRWRPLSAGPTPEEAEAGIQLAELGEATPETLVAELARAEARAEGALGETPLFLKFQALVHLHPEVSPRLGQLLASAPGEGLTLRVLGPALAGSGRAEAQAALAEVVRGRRNDGPALAELIPTLARANAPTPVVEAALFRLASEGSEEVRSTAQLALGTLAHRLAPSAPARADAIVRWALGELTAARSPAGQRQMLLVLGNAGAPAALPALGPFLRAQEPEVRGGAVTALRRLKAPEAEAALCLALTADPDAGVRLEVAQALGTRRPTAPALAAHALVLRKDRSPGVRLAALRNLGRCREVLPGAVPLIREAAAEDPDAEVRGAAAALLAEPASPAGGA